MLRLNNGECLKNVKINHKPIICSSKSEKLIKKLTKCDFQTCTKSQIHYVMQREECKCVWKKMIKKSLCCCTNRLNETRKVCSSNGVMQEVCAKIIKLQNKQLPWL